VPALHDVEVAVAVDVVEVAARFDGVDVRLDRVAVPAAVLGAPEPLHRVVAGEGEVARAVTVDVHNEHGT
jgi:hypothetical protein